MAVTLKSLRVHITRADGTTPALGVVTISSTYALRDASNSVVHGPVHERLVLDEAAAGVATVQLPATDDPALSPTGWTYTVCVDTDAWRQVFAIEVPYAASGTLQLAAIAPAVSAPAVVTYALASQLAGYLPRTGGTLTGALVLAGAPTQGLHAATKTYVDQALTPYLPLAGGTLTGALVLAGAPTQDLHPATKAYVDQAVEDALGGVEGGGGSQVVVRQAYVTTGNVAPLPDTGGAWVTLAGFELTIPAVVGDYVELAIHAMRSNNETSFIDAAVLVGSTPVHYLATGTSSPAIEGDPGWYPGAPGTHYPAQSGPRGFTVTADHLDAGNVRFVLVCKAAGAGTLYASGAFPFYWRALNRGPVA